MTAALTLSVVALSLQVSIGAEKHEEPVPSSLAPAIRGALAPGGVRAGVGNAQLDFWFVKTLPLKADGSTSWAAVEEGTLVGVVRLAAEFRDIRARLIKPGVYTLRFGLQPQNGDHLGVSPFREFLLLSPAAADTDLPARGHEGTIELSIKTAGGSHPAVWSIDPPTTSAAALANHTTELGHKSFIVEVPVARPGETPGTLRFGIVLIGRVEA